MPKAILLIDDDADDRALFSEALMSVDTSITFKYAEDAEEGFRTLRGDVPFAPDVIFLDINLPLMSGWQFLRELKSIPNLKDIRVIMYSTSSHQRDKFIAEELGAFCFITKPTDYKALKNMLGTIIANFDDEGKLADVCKDIERLQHS